MSTTKKYSDLYSENFKDYFGNHKEVLTEMNLLNKHRIFSGRESTFLLN